MNMNLPESEPLVTRRAFLKGSAVDERERWHANRPDTDGSAPLTCLRLAARFLLLASAFHATLGTAAEVEPAEPRLRASESLPGEPGYRGCVVSHTHSDLCWPDTPEVCMNANVAALAKSVELAEKFSNYRFTMEHAIVLREYLRRNPDKTKVVKELMRAGVIETGAFYTGPWELTCGGEGLVRQLYLGKRWVKKNLGVDADTVWNVDVAGHTMQLPQILHKAGIRGLVISAGAVDATFDTPYVAHRTRGPFLFRWQSPDGSSIPTWTTPWGYGAGHALGLRDGTLEHLSQRLPAFLDDVRQNHAAHGLPRIAFITDGTDIESPTAQVAANIERWNAEKRYPPLVYSSTARLFGAIEREPLPTLAGEMPSPWDQVQAQGAECFLLDRRLEGRLLAAEKFAALASLVVPGFVYPRERFDAIWEDRLFAVEHNWGGKNGQTSNQEKTAKIREADAANDAILSLTFQALAGAVRFSRPDTTRVLVFNSLSWDREDIVTCTLPVSEDKAAQLVVLDSHGTPVAHQPVRRDGAAPEAAHAQIVFCAQVPSLGYATYYITPSGAAPQAASPFRADSANLAFDNDFYRIMLDAATGGIRSLYDKRTQKELVRQGSNYACNELMALEDDDVDIRRHLTGRQWRMREHPSTIKVVENGPVRLVVEVAGRFLENSRRTQEIILYRNLARIDLVTTLDWEGRTNVQVCAVFPLNPTQARLKYAVPYGWELFGSEMKYAAPWPFGPVAGYNGRGVRGWMELADETQAVTLASECNFATLRDSAAAPETGYLLQPMLLRTVRSCGDASLFYTQKGRHRFRFAIQSQADSARLGEEHSSPLLVHVVTGKASSPASLPERFSFLQVRPNHVQLAVAKKAEEGEGIILRLVETRKTPGKTQAEVRAFRRISRAVKTTIVEEDQEPLSAQDKIVSVPIRPLGIETFRVVF